MEADEAVPGRIRVLLIDDQAMFAESIGRLLEREEGLEIVGIHGTVRDGLDAVLATEPDVAIVDWNLPDGTGADATAAILAASGSTRVLVLTGSYDDGVLVAAIESGCSGFVTKDKAIDELVSAVRLTHAGEAYIPPATLAQLLPHFGRTAPRSAITDLSSREREILHLVATGLSNKAVAEQLFLSVHTVRNHVQNMLAKLNAHSKLEAVAIATREGLLRAG